MRKACAMSPKYLIAAIFLSFLLLPAAAIDYASLGLEETGTKVEDGISWVSLSDGSGAEILYAASLELDAARSEALAFILEAVRSWEGLEPSRVKILNDESQLRVTVLPRTLRVGGTDLLPAIPGGLVFWFDRAVEYDFRVLSGIYAIRLAGLFSNAGSLGDSILQVYKDPVGWIVQRDPVYAVRLTTELAQRVARLEAEGKAEAAARQEQAAALRASLDAAVADALAAVAASGKEAASRAEANEAVLAAQAAAIARLEEGLMTALNAGFLGSPKPIDPEAVAWLLERRAENPAMTRAELVAAAKAAKIPLGDKQVGIVLFVKFGER